MGFRGPWTGVFSGEWDYRTEKLGLLTSSACQMWQVGNLASNSRRWRSNEDWL